MKKDSLRKKFLKKREELIALKLEEDSLLLNQKCIELIKKYHPKYVHCFLPIHSKGEINTLEIIQYCWKNKINVVVPVSNFDEGTMQQAEFKSDTKTKLTKYNITEPVDPIWINNQCIDIVITPLLAFDLKGYRVGYGGGFYDRFFSSLPLNVKKIGISLFDPCTCIEDITELDMPMTHCITPKKIYTF